MFEQIVVEPFREQVRVVDAALQPLGDAQQIEIHLQIFFGVAQKKTLLEVGERRALLQAVIGGKHRAAGNAGDEIDAIEQRGRAAGGRRLVECGQNAVGEGRRAGSAAGE